ncbi:MAG: EF-hand domain-containing protein [Sphingomonas bacterium]|nr:EF-hand domain-containing protein [Sphingomonas bacterium]
MRSFIAPLLLVTALGACNTVRGVSGDVQSVANAFDPSRTYSTCGTYGTVDRNNDGRISRSEYDAYRGGAYGAWDTNRDGRISRSEYANCWYGGGFYTNYNRSAYEPSYTVFDTNRDGYLSADEYYSAQAWPGLDRNGDGIIDSSEWRW